MSDSVAQDQIKAFVERILRPGIVRPSQLAAAITDRDARLEHCLARLVEFDRHAPLPIQRARSAAGSLLGCTSDTVVHRASMWKRHGSLQGALKALDWMAGAVWPVPELPDDLVGYVYGMVAADFPGIGKIGFSADPHRRLRELQSAHRIALRLVAFVPGTRVDESLIHNEMRAHALANEWFDLDGRWQQSKPLAFVMQPKRMWRELKEVA